MLVKQIQIHDKGAIEFPKPAPAQPQDPPPPPPAASAPEPAKPAKTEERSVKV